MWSLTRWMLRTLKSLAVFGAVALCTGPVRSQEQKKIDVYGANSNVFRRTGSLGLIGTLGAGKPGIYANYNEGPTQDKYSTPRKIGVKYMPSSADRECGRVEKRQFKYRFEYHLTAWVHAMPVDFSNTAKAGASVVWMKNDVPGKDACGASPSSSGVTVSFPAINGYSPGSLTIPNPGEANTVDFPSVTGGDQVATDNDQHQHLKGESCEYSFYVNAAVSTDAYSAFGSDADATADFICFTKSSGPGQQFSVHEAFKWLAGCP